MISFLTNFFIFLTKESGEKMSSVNLTNFANFPEIFCQMLEMAKIGKKKPLGTTSVLKRNGLTSYSMKWN